MEFNGERFVPLKELMHDEIALEHYHRYHAVLDLVKGKKILDIACGEGYGTSLLAQNALEVTGIDIDPACILHATNTYSPSHSNIKFIEGSAQGIPMNDASVDVVICFETIEHLDEDAQEAFLLEVKRVMKKDGILVMSTPDKSNYSDRFSFKNEFHEREFTKKDFEGFLTRHFQHVNLFYQGYEIVSAITKEEMSSIQKVQVLNWERDPHTFSRKYLVAVCSGKEMTGDIRLSSVVFQGDKDYLKLMDRAVEMEAHILELGAWGKRLDQEILEKDKIINHYKDMYSSEEAKTKNLLQEKQGLESHGKFLEDAVTNQLASISARLQDMTQKDQLISELETEIASKDGIVIEARDEVNKISNLLAELELRLVETQSRLDSVDTELSKRTKDSERMKEDFEQQNGVLTREIPKLENKLKGLQDVLSDRDIIIDDQKQHISLLSQKFETVSNRLNEIYSSEGWKLLKVYYNFKGKLIPEDSNRYKVLKKSFNKLRGKKEVYEGVKPKTAMVEPSIADINVRPAVYDVIEFPVYASPSVSIVLPAYNGWHLTYKCLASIKENTMGVAYEIIIGDDASTDETKDIGKYIKNIVVIRNEKNLEFLYNCNHAATFARGKYILFLNNDTEVRPGWLSSMVDLMENDEKIGMTGSKLIYPNGKLQEAGAIVWKDATGWNFGHRQDPDAPEFNYVKEADYISGASILIRTSLWMEIGGFDTLYAPAYSEDSDLAFEVRKHGYKVVYQPLSEVIHYEGYTHGTDNEEGIKEGGIKGYQKLNAVKFQEKWKDVLEKDHFPNAEKVFWARDKSRYKKTILVIDHYVPHFDKDAGSRTTYQLLQLFVEMDYNVKFIGDNFFKHEPYTTILQQMGIEVLYGPWYAENWPQWLKDNAEMIDFVFLNRPHISVKYIDFLKNNLTAKIIYYGHDLHYIREKRQYEIEQTSQLLHSMKEWKEIETSLVQRSDTVLTLSCDEKEIMEKELQATDVRIMPAFFYEKFKQPITDFSGRKDVLFVGGFNHKPNVDAIHWFTKDIWPQVTKGIPGVRLIIVGSSVPQSIIDLESDTINVKGYVTDRELADIYKSVKTVVVPLRYGAGVKGKTVEAMCEGLPVISTSFGVEGLEQINQVIQPHDSAVDFARQLINLYSDEKQLVAISEKEVNYAKMYFSKSRVRDLIATIFNTK